MSDNKKLPTEFAPAERASDETLQEQFELIQNLPLVREFLDAIPNMSVILNHERQIIYANKAFLDFLGEPEFKELLGKRQGEALNCQHPYNPIGARTGEAIQCVHATETEGGCGTTLFCRTCGAVKSILQAQETQEPSIEECRMTRRKEEKDSALDLRVWSKPVIVGKNVFTIFSVMDISDEKRRRVLERIFFHDIMNTAGGMQGLANILAETDLNDEEMNEISDLLHGASNDLIEEISAQRTLSAAESGELASNPVLLHSLALLRAAETQIENHDVACDKKVVIAPSATETDFHCDYQLIRRVLINLIKNALEASNPGDTITIDCHDEGDSMAFTVHNKSVMPLDVQLQIFNRSFSTKGSNRGIGTYSIKLITERYLNGKVSFISSVETGTLFKVILPMDA